MAAEIADVVAVFNEFVVGAIFVVLVVAADFAGTSVEDATILGVCVKPADVPVGKAVAADVAGTSVEDATILGVCVKPADVAAEKADVLI